MALPFFYISSCMPDQQEITLDEDNSRHVIQVLRMHPGETLQLTDGKGTLLDGVILDDHKKKCRVAIKNSATESPRTSKVTIAISPVKNSSRFEWFLEKATEIGVSTIIPLLCERTERQSIRTDRLRNILVSAMLQSQQAWLPVLTEPTPLPQLLGQTPSGQAYIAHLLEEPRPTASLASLVRSQDNSLILIGPEGDFTSKEVEAALAANFIPVGLGHNRLRTETAGIVAATILCIQ
jgi:16S rRNA (uracil1498-N3)-methyltransferase